MTITGVPIPTDVSNENKTQWLAENLDKFCVLPWINLHTSPDGKVKLCCSIQYVNYVTDVEDTPFNFGHDKIEDIWNSISMLYTRQMHRSNRGFSACQECYKVEKISGHSPRMGQNDEWRRRKEKDEFTANIFDGIAQENVTALDHLPISLELRLGNLCNLQCITCYALSSSPIYDERAELLANGEVDDPKYSWLKSVWQQEKDMVDQTDVKNWYDTDTFYENFKKLAPNLKRLYTTGGEPTLIKANYKMMQMLLDAGYTDCAIEFTSNMSSWNYEFYSRLEKFKNVEIQMSFDGADEVGNFIRFPSDTAKVRENIMRAVDLASVRPNWKVKCYTVLQALNYRHLLPIWETLREAADTYCKHIDWWPITLYAPPHLALGAVPMEQRLEWVEEFKQLAADFSTNNFISYFRISEDTMKPCLDSILTPAYDPELNVRLRNHVHLMDKTRKLEGTKIFETELS
jgi:sulfatase maturation enzyme AslB (radical SAM superfamily)